MIKQTIVWTALPFRTSGPLAAGAELRLAVFVAPRLWNDDASVKQMKLSAFPDWLDWPQAVSQAAFQVVFDGGPTVTATPDLTPLRSDLWQALFKPDTDVVPFAFEDLSGLPLESFPAGAIHDLIRDLYRRAASDPAYGAGSDLPHRDRLAADPDLRAIARPVRPEPPYRPVDPDRGPVRIDEPGGSVPDPGPDVPPGPGPTLPGPGPFGPIFSGCLGCLLLPYYLLRAVLKRLGWLATLPFAAFGAGGGGANPKQAAFDQLHAYVKPSLTSAPLPSAAEVAALYDFHKMIAALGDYPRLLRYMGLVVDVVVTVPAALPPATGLVKVLPSLPLATPTTHYAPRTHYELGPERFVARPRPTEPESSQGLLRLNDTAQFRIIQLDVAGSGIKLQNTATNVVGQQTLDAWSANSPEDAGLPALQTAGVSIVRLNRAARLRENFRRAYALNARLAAVDLSPALPLAGGGPPPPASDELLAEDITRGYRLDVFDDQSQTWHSLCRRIGAYRFLDAPGGVTLADEHDEGFVQLGATEPLPGAGPRVLQVHESLFTWDGWSLSAPRPGLTIMPDDTHATPANMAVTTFKLETSFRARPGSLPRLRFGYRYRLRARLVDLAGNSAFGPDEAAFAETQAEVTPEFKFQRFEPVSPPPVVLRAVPLEGESLEQVVVRSTIDDPPAAILTRSSDRHLVPPKVAQLMAERHRKFDAAPGMNSGPAAYDLASREAGSLTHRFNPATGNLELIPGVQEVTSPERTYWLQTRGQFEVAYLPDPAARGVLLLGLPGLAAFDAIVEPGGGLANKLPFDGVWPNLLPVRLRLVGREAGAAPAPPSWDAGTRALTVQLPQGETAAVRISSYFHAGDLDNMAVWGWLEEAAPGSLAALKAQAVAGRNWLHLPYRTLTLVHAVQQPLAIPSVAALAPAKLLGATSATLSGQINLNAKSTGKIEIRAAWQDPFDDPVKPSYNSATDVVNQTTQVGERLVVDPSNDVLAVADLVHALGDTKYHRVTYTPVATTRFREFFPSAVLANADNLIRPRASELGSPGALAAPLAVDIPNSARPASARPVYVLPTWAWSETSAGPVTTHFRQGGGLRVYLERPWFSSGAGELLGVVVRSDGGPVTGKAGETLRKYTSEWGVDPIRRTAGAELLTLAHLLDPQATGQFLSLEALPGVAVHVAGYAPEYDAGRNLWVCDLALKAPTQYFPFVRLALARFQPISLAGAHLSAVEQADYTQVVPDRRVDYDLARLGVDGSLPIRVAGPTYIMPGREQLQTTILVARLERRQFELLNDELGWEPMATVILNPTVMDLAETVWEGALTVPVPAPGALRVTVLEIELFAADAGVQRDLIGLISREAQAEANLAGAMLQREGLGYRVVFADALALP